MNGDKIMDAIGMIDEELIIEARETRKRRLGTKKVLALVAAVLILAAISVTAVAKGVFENKLKNIDIINEFFDKNENIDSYVLEFDVEIPKDAKETIEKYYIPMILTKEEYDASANSYAGHFYWENKNEKQIIGFSQYSALTFDEYSCSFAEKMKVTEEKILFGGEEIESIIFTSEEKENSSIKQIYWSDGYNIFKIMAINCNDEFIKEVIESIKKVENFSDYGKLRENKYH